MLILQDSREKTPLHFPKDWEIHKCTLKTGDYSIAFEKREKYSDQDLGILCIERKKSVSELAMNITQPRFKKCLERISTYQHKYLLCEFSFEQILQYPKGSNIPRSKLRYIRVKPPFIISCLSAITVKYGISPIFAGDSSNASYIATELIKRCIKEYGDPE